jgi:hypothetical protein
MRIAGRRRLLVISLAVMAGLVAGVSLYGLSSALQEEDRKGDPSQDPCYKLSADECRALIEQSSADFFTKLSRWVLTIPTDEEYLRSLPQSETLADGPPPLGDLASATSVAQLVAVGTSMSMAFNENLTSTITFEVEDYVKGSGPRSMEIVLGGGPQPYPDWDHPTLGLDPASPLLLPGDRALLFLGTDPTTGEYGVFPFAGYYRLSDAGEVLPLQSNTFADSMRGKTLAEFSAEIKALAAEQAAQ